jgi:Carboxypeptidase regulatory-like domain
VRLRDEARNQNWAQTTNAEGFFEFRALPFGDYTIAVEHPRFIKEVIENIALQVAQTQDLQITLQLGAIHESIVVQADGGLLEASDASLSQVIDDKRLLGFPINGRNVMQLVSLSAGVINGGRASATQRQANYGPGFSVGGQRDNTSVVLMDGIEISGQELNNYPLAIPPLDSVAEFRVQTTNYSAEFWGNSGAVINVASKRGSNEFHSTTFEFFRNDALDARNYFNTTIDPLKTEPVRFRRQRAGVHTQTLQRQKQAVLDVCLRRDAATGGHQHNPGTNPAGARRGLQWLVGDRRQSLN